MVLLTGGSGVLGKELVKHRYNEDWYVPTYVPTHEELDILNPGPGLADVPPIFLIIHCAAYTDVAKAEVERKECFTTNVLGTRALASLGIPIIYISTDYIFDGEDGNYKEDDIPYPVNFYGLSKLLGEYEVQNTEHRIIRTSFRPYPFPHRSACTDAYTSADYVDVIAKEIALAVKNWEELPHIIHIGTERKSHYELANKFHHHAIAGNYIGPTTRAELGVKIPKDSSLDSSLWRKFKTNQLLTNQIS